MVKGPFDFVNAINDTYEDVMTIENQRGYQPFLINRAFSYFPDSVFHANEMNKAHQLPVEMQYDFYRYGLSKRKRFSKWYKKEKSELIDAIRSYYGYTREKASQVEKILSDKAKERLLELYKYISE